MATSRLFVTEPPAAYASRPRLVVDASVLAAFFYGEENAEQAETLLHNRLLCAPTLVDLEIASTGLTKVRRGLMALEVVKESLDDFTTLELERHETPATAVFGIAHRYGLSAYDAAYLWLAGSLGAPLATFDARLDEAAKKHLSGTPPTT